MRRFAKLKRPPDEIQLDVGFCMICGESTHNQPQWFAWSLESPYLGFLNALSDVGLIASYFLEEQVWIEAPFCETCQPRFARLERTGQLLHLLFVGVIFITVFAAVLIGSFVSFTGSLVILGIGVIVAIGVRIWAGRFIRIRSPRIRASGKRGLAIKVPGRDTLLVER